MPNSINKSLNYITFLDAKVSTTYFTSFDNKAMFVYYFKHQLTRLLLNMKIKSNIDFLVI